MLWYVEIKPMHSIGSRRTSGMVCNVVMTDVLTCLYRCIGIDWSGHRQQALRRASLSLDPCSDVLDEPTRSTVVDCPDWARRKQGHIAYTGPAFTWDELDNEQTLVVVCTSSFATMHIDV